MDHIHKEQISKELANEQHKLAKNFYGSKVLKSCAIQTVRSNNKNMEDLQEKATRKRQNFEETFRATAKKSKLSEEQEKESNSKTMYAMEMAVLGFGHGDKDNNNSNIRQKVSSILYLQQYN